MFEPLCQITQQTGISQEASLVYSFKAPNGLLMSLTLRPLVFGYETLNLVVRGVHCKHTVG